MSAVVIVMTRGKTTQGAAAPFARDVCCWWQKGTKKRTSDAAHRRVSAVPFQTSSIFSEVKLPRVGLFLCCPLPRQLKDHLHHVMDDLVFDDGPGELGTVEVDDRNLFLFVDSKIAFVRKDFA